MSHIYSARTFTPYFLKTRFNIILPSMSKSPVWSHLSLSFSHNSTYTHSPVHLFVRLHITKNSSAINKAIFRISTPLYRMVLLSDWSVRRLLAVVPSPRMILPISCKAQTSRCWLKSVSWLQSFAFSGLKSENATKHSSSILGKITIHITWQHICCLTETLINSASV